MTLRSVHILMTVPDRVKWLSRFQGEAREAKFLKHVSSMYSKAFIGHLQGELAELRGQGRAADAEVLLTSFNTQLCDVSRFVKEPSGARWTAARQPKGLRRGLNQLKERFCLRLSAMRSGLMAKELESIRFVAFALV